MSCFSRSLQELLGSFKFEQRGQGSSKMTQGSS